MLWFVVFLGTSSARAEEAPEVAALGRYLAADCVSCHRGGQGGKAVPSLAGRPASEIAALIRAYQTGERTNSVMVSVAQSLTAKDIVAVGAYFESMAAGGTEATAPGTD